VLQMRKPPGGGYGGRMSWLVAVVLKPLILTIYYVVVGLCNWLVFKLMPDCKLKRALMKRY
jgi:hypothetical protein